MIWLIGNRGMLGSEVEILLKNYGEYIASDAEIDITNYQQLEKFASGRQINKIINCAAYTQVDQAETEYQKACAINGEAVLHLARLAKKLEATILHISTDYVFDGKAKKPYVETEIPTPISAYGKSKRQGEIYLEQNWQKHYIIRTAWLYGARGKNFVYTMLRLFRERDIVSVVDDQWGNPTWTHDLAQVIISLLDSKAPYGVYHFTNEGDTTWYQFAKQIYQYARQLSLIEKDVELKAIATEDYPTPTPRPGYSCLSRDKISKATSVSAKSWQTALAQFLKSETKNE